MFDKTKQFVDSLFNKSGKPNRLDHFQNVLDSLLTLAPDADEPMRIAAYAHDINRAYVQVNFRGKDFDDPEYLTQHQEQCANIICEFLRQEDYDKKQIDRVYNMVRHHEVGGDKESDLLMDADSIGYLIKPAHIRPEHIQSLGKEKVRSKLDYMYNRISSAEHKALAKPYYDKALELLEAY